MAVHLAHPPRGHRVRRPQWGVARVIAGTSRLTTTRSRTVGSAELSRGWAIPCATDIAFSAMIARVIFPSHSVLVALSDCR